MKEEDVNEAEQQENRLPDVESLKVKTNIKAGGDPPTPGGGEGDPDPPG